MRNTWWIQSVRNTHGEEVGAAFGLLADGRWRVGGLRHVDAELLLAGARRGRHRGRVVAQTAAAVTRLDRAEKLMLTSAGGSLTCMTLCSGFTVQRWKSV